MNIVVFGCGYIAGRVANGINYSDANLYGFASRNIEKAKEYKNKYNAIKYFTYEESLLDKEVDVIYITTPNPTHYEYTKQALIHKKHVICEKPFVSSQKEAIELFELSKENKCFLMEAHKTCFTPLNQYLLSRINEIGTILSIEAGFTSSFHEENCKQWNIDEHMGGSFYDLGVYPLCFANLYANSKVKETNFNIQMYKNNKCDQKCECNILYENGISASLLSCWGNQDYNFGKAIIKGTKGYIEIDNFWKSDKAKWIVNGKVEEIKVEQKSDFTGEINHAYKCIKENLLESPVLSKKAILQILFVLEKMKEERMKRC